MTQPISPTPPSRGLYWISQALGMLKRYPSIFLPMGMMVALIQLIPLIGGLVLFVTGPALIAGTVTAAARVDKGDKPRIGQLFAMFEEPVRRRRALKLSLPIIIGKLLALFLIVFMLAQHVARAGMDISKLENNPAAIMPLLMSNQMLPWLIIGLVMIVFGWACIALAIPEVALRDTALMAAIKQSIAYIKMAWLAWLLMFVTFVLGFAIIVMLLISLHSLLLAQFGFTTLVYALLGPLFYAAWKDYQGAAAPAESKAPSSNILAA